MNTNYLISYLEKQTKKTDTSLGEDREKWVAVEIYLNFSKF